MSVNKYRSILQRAFLLYAFLLIEGCDHSTSNDKVSEAPSFSQYESDPFYYYLTNAFSAGNRSNIPPDYEPVAIGLNDRVHAVGTLIHAKHYSYVLTAKHIFYGRSGEYTCERLSNLIPRSYGISSVYPLNGDIAVCFLGQTKIIDGDADAFRVKLSTTVESTTPTHIKSLITGKYYLLMEEDVDKYGCAITQYTFEYDGLYGYGESGMGFISEDGALLCILTGSFTSESDIDVMEMINAHKGYPVICTAVRIASIRSLVHFIWLGAERYQ